MVGGNEEQRRDTTVSVAPALVLGLGKFGREVCIQLVMHLTEVEETFKEAGVTHSLLVREESYGSPTPGLMRVMDLDWERWFLDGKGYESATFLKDTLPLHGNVQGTPPQRREGDLENVAEAREGLEKMGPRLSAILESMDLRKRVNRAGFIDYDSPLRIFVICAAREPGSATLTPDILKQLRKVTKRSEKQIQGIELFCYVGGTSLSEHLLAGGGEEDYHQGFPAEIARILPAALALQQPLNTPPHSEKLSSLQPVKQTSLLDCLLAMCKPKSPYADLIKTCYLLDGCFEKGSSAVRGRSDKPDDVVLATALAVSLLLLSNASQVVQQEITDQRNQLGSPIMSGPFVSFGIASYIVDSSKFQHFVYHKVADDFLTSLTQASTRSPLVEEKAATYRSHIDFEHIRASIPRQREMLSEQGHEQALAELLSTKNVLKEVTDRLNRKLTDKVDINKIEQYVEGQQANYKQFMDDQLKACELSLYGEEQAPLLRVSQLLEGGLHALEQQSSPHNGEQTSLRFPRRASYLAEIRQSFNAIEHVARLSLLGALGRAFLVTLALLLSIWGTTWVHWLFFSSNLLPSSWLLWPLGFIILWSLGIAFWKQIERFIGQSWEMVSRVIHQWQAYYHTWKRNKPTHFWSIVSGRRSGAGGTLHYVQPLQKGQRLQPYRRKMGFWFRFIGAFGWTLLMVIVLFATGALLMHLQPFTITKAKLGPFAFPNLSFMLISMVIFWSFIIVISHVTYDVQMEQQVQSLNERYRSLLTEMDHSAYQQAVAMSQREVLARLNILYGLRGVIGTLQKRLSLETLEPLGPDLEHLFADDQIIDDLKSSVRDLAGAEKLWAKRAQMLQELVEFHQEQPLDEGTLEEWILRHVAAACQNDTKQIRSAIQATLKKTIEKPVRLEYKWSLLERAAESLLRSRMQAQTLGSEKRLFAAYGLHHLEELKVYAQYVHAHACESADPLRWTFMRVRVGYPLEAVNFLATSLGPLGLSSDNWPTI